jgi:putative tricarboxylic transport membrane protein
MLVAVLPGLTLVMGVVLALPFTYKMGVGPALILLSAMYVSGTYGGAITSILFKIPGEPMDVPLLWDGYTMTKQGQASKALGYSLVAALVGGLFSSVVMVALSDPVADIALKFSSPEFFAITFFGLISVVALGGPSVVNSLISLCLGLLIASVGVDDTYGAERLTFGVPILMDGIDYLLVMVGAYGIGEVLNRFADRYKSETDEKVTATVYKTNLPSLSELLKRKAAFLRASVTGLLVGLVPGAGATIASFVAYGIEKQYGKNGHRLGTGEPDGIIAAKAAATSSVGGAMIPLLTLGIPGSGATAIILAAFLLHGIQPGPEVFINNTELVYTIFAAIIASVIGMCILGFLAIKPLCKVLEAPEALISSFVIVFCFVGAFASRNNVTDLYIISIFGLLGFLFERYKFPIAPLVLGAILGPHTERAFVTTMISFDNDWTVFFTRPISGVIMVFALLALTMSLFKKNKALSGGS